MFSRVGAYWSRGSADYAPLPSLSPDAVRTEVSSRARRIIRQRNFKLLLLLLVLGAIVILSTSIDSSLFIRKIQIPPIDPLHPPLYEDLEAFEIGLPQHDVTLPSPEGLNGHYFYPANHIWGIGFNNVLQEHLLLAHLAYLSNRTFVFDPYTWYWDPNEPYGDYDGKLVPSRIPWHAFFQGSLVGDAFPPGVNSTPRPVRKEFFKKVCPQADIISSSVVNANFQEAYPVAIDVTNAWLDYLRSVDSPCIEIDGWSPHIYETGVFMSSMITTIYDSLINSPFLKSLSWSKLVDSAISLNIDILRPKTSRFTGTIWGAQKDDLSTSSFPGLLAIHVRRGDYEEHCHNLEDLSATMQGWYSLPGIPDQFSPPQGYKTEERHKYFQDHCWPTIEQMVEKIRQVRATSEGEGLDSVYIMTNGNHEFVEILEKAIRELGGFKVISSSRDMIWTPESKYISQAIDMAIANRAQVFIGNGFSSLSSNVVLLRFKDSMPPGSNRVW